jgi:hypothetical protein
MLMGCGVQMRRACAMPVEARDLLLEIAELCMRVCVAWKEGNGSVGMSACDGGWGWLVMEVRGKFIRSWTRDVGNMGLL